MSSLRKFVISYSHFFAGGIFNMLFGLITFPILTRILTTEEYGVIGLVSTTMFFAIAIAKAGLSEGIIRYYESYHDTAGRRLEFASTIAIRGFTFSVLTFLLYIIIIPRISDYLHIKHQYLVCFIIVGTNLLLCPLNILVFTLLRASGKTLLFSVIAFTGKVMSFGISFFFLIYLIKEFYGYFVGLVLSEFIVSLFLFWWFFSNYKIAISKVSGSLTMDLIKFGFPLLVNELSYLLLSYADRYMIAGYKGEGTLGIYSVGYNIAAYISGLISFSLSYAVVPLYVAIYEKDGKEKTREFLQKCLRYMLILIIPLCVGYYAVSKDLFITLASEKYIEAASFSPIILLGTFFLGANNILNAGLYLEKRSRTIFFIMLAAVVTNIGLNFFLIPLYGVTGAAFATLVACILTMVLTIFLSNKIISLKVDTRDILFYIMSSGIMYYVLTKIHITTVWMELLAKIIAGILFITPIVLLKEKEILTQIKSIIPVKVSNK